MGRITKDDRCLIMGLRTENCFACSDCLTIHRSCSQGKSGKNQKIRKSREILHFKVKENSEGQGKSGNSKVPGCIS